MPAPVGVCTASTKSVENIASSLQSLLSFFFFFFFLPRGKFRHEEYPAQECAHSHKPIAGSIVGRCKSVFGSNAVTQIVPF
jgi:hypothetical protein